jgi:hypothetical protein
MADLTDAPLGGFTPGDVIFGGPDIEEGGTTQDLQPSLVTNGNSVHSATVASTYDLAASLVTDGETVH